MANICSRNWKSIGGFTVQDCRPTVPGCAGRAWLFDKDIYDAYTVTWNTDSTTPAMDHQYIQNIVVGTNDKGIRCESFGMPYVGACTVSDESYFVKIQHQVTIRVYQRSFRAKELIDALVYSPCVIVLENLDPGADLYDSTLKIYPGHTIFEMYGGDVGIRLSALNTTTDLTNEAAYELTFSTDPELSEKSVPVSVLVPPTGTYTIDTIKAATRAMLDAATSANTSLGHYEFEGARKKYFGSMGVTTFTPEVVNKTNGPKNS